MKPALPLEAPSVMSVVSGMLGPVPLFEDRTERSSRRRGREKPVVIGGRLIPVTSVRIADADLLVGIPLCVEETVKAVGASRHGELDTLILGPLDIHAGRGVPARKRRIHAAQLPLPLREVLAFTHGPVVPGVVSHAGSEEGQTFGHDHFERAIRGGVDTGGPLSSAQADVLNEGLDTFLGLLVDDLASEQDSTVEAEV